MPTEKQKLGEFGERMVTKHLRCPRCKKEETLKMLRQNFKCADIVCDFCGYLAQVKTKRVSNIDRIPSTLPAAAWDPQKERMDAGIYFPLFIVLKKKDTKDFSIYYLSADLQTPEMFIKRKKLKPTAKRAGWRGYTLDLRKAPEGSIVRWK